MARWALGIEYLGSGFHGWQAQGHDPNTLQAHLDQAISRVANEPVVSFCAGRTDAGVHAACQVVHFDTQALREPQAWVLGVNQYLPNALRVLWAVAVSDDFHARFSARRRVYHYGILNRPEPSAIWHNRLTWIRSLLDLDALNQGASYLLGQHDFSAFRAVGCQAKTPVRTIYGIECFRMGSVIWLRVEADAFLQHMIRNIVGTLLPVGRGIKPASWVQDCLISRDRAQSGPTAKPDGLYLTHVSYPDFSQIPAAIWQPWVV